MADDNLLAIAREIEKRLSHGVQAAVEAAAESYRKKVTAQQSPPTSDPGEYPHEDTGQGAENISYGIDRAPEHEVVGRFGLFGDDSPIPQFEGQDHVGGEHLQWLKEDMGRLGMDNSFIEDLDRVRRAFRRGSQS